VEDKISCYYNTILCGDYHSFKTLWRHDLDPQNSTMMAPERFFELSSQLRSQYGYFAFANFIKVHSSIMLSTKFEFEAFFNLKRGIRNLFSFDIEHKFASAADEDEEKHKEKKGFLSNITNTISNAAVVRNNVDRFKNAAHEIAQLQDESEDIKDFSSSTSGHELAPDEQPKKPLAALNTSPPAKETFVGVQVVEKEKTTISSSVVESSKHVTASVLESSKHVTASVFEASKHGLGSLSSSIKHMTGKTEEKPKEVEKPKEEKKISLGGLASKFGISKKS